MWVIAYSAEAMVEGNERARLENLALHRQCEIRGENASQSPRAPAAAILEMSRTGSMAETVKRSLTYLQIMHLAAVLARRKLGAWKQLLEVTAMTEFQKIM